MVLQVFDVVSPALQSSVLNYLIQEFCLLLLNCGPVTVPYIPASGTIVWNMAEQPFLSDYTSANKKGGFENGIGENDAPPSYEGSEDQQFALLSIHTLDRVRFSRLSPTEIDRIRGCVISAYTPGLMHCRLYHQSTEFKLKGVPFANASKTSSQAIKLVQTLLAELYQMGLQVEQSSIICKKAEQKGTNLSRTLMLRTNLSNRHSTTPSSVRAANAQLMDFHILRQQ